MSEIKPGMKCTLRPQKPDEELGNWGANSFPVVILRPFIEGFWWVEDPQGRVVWMNGKDLVPCTEE